MLVKWLKQTRVPKHILCKKKKKTKKICLVFRQRSVWKQASQCRQILFGVSALIFKPMNIYSSVFSTKVNSHQQNYANANEIHAMACVITKTAAGNCNNNELKVDLVL